MAQVSGKTEFSELSAAVSRFAKDYGFLRVSLFGSRARGDNSESSDYDFCVLPSSTNSLLDLSGFRIDMTEYLDSEVDVISERGLSDRFRQSIEPEMVLLYEA
ncbi:MAG: nucleotidyltransferase domain-containing protein [archaeon]|nr:nucleotidyltransferase domain-containing protein [archaeon]